MRRRSPLCTGTCYTRPVRVPLPQQPVNGGPTPIARVFVISGMVSQALFRLPGRLWPHPEHRLDLALLFMGAPGFGAGAESETDPYFVLRRAFEDGQAVVAARIEWEGIFTILANDDEHAEQVFRGLIVPAGPEEVVREWSEDVATLEMFSQLLSLT